MQRVSDVVLTRHGLRQHPHHYNCRVSSTSLASKYPMTSVNQPILPSPKLIFVGRWPQWLLCMGLIVAQAVYAYHFWVELGHLIEAAFGNERGLAK